MRLRIASSTLKPRDRGLKMSARPHWREQLTVLRKNKRQRRSSIVHLGSVSGHHDDHHRVHELHTQITRLIEENKIDEHPESSKGSAVTETKNHQFKKDTISLSNNDAFDILHALNVWNILNVLKTEEYITMFTPLYTV